MSNPGNRAWRPLPRHRYCTGHSLLELIIAVAIIGVLAGIAMDRVLFYQERAEKAAMESTLALVKMSLQMRLAELIVANRQQLAVDLEQENPMKLLDPPPGNYAGSYITPARGGSWYYADKERELVYVPSGTAYLTGGKDNPKELRFRVVIQTEKNARTGQAAPIGVALSPNPGFQWF